jgi:aminopeptidase N
MLRFCFALMLLIIISRTIKCQINYTYAYKPAFIEKQKFYNQLFFNSSNSDNRINIIYHKIHWDINPEKNYIKGSVFTIFKCTEETKSLEFDLSDTLFVDSILYRGQRISFLHQRNKIIVEFDKLFNQNEIDSIEIFYQGIPFSSGLGSFKQTYHNKMPIIWTLSEPYGAADWWPCRQNLYDKIDSLDIFITTPDNYTPVTNGKLLSVFGTDHKTWHYKHRYPIAAYLVCLAVTNYHSYSYYIKIGNDSMDIINYVYPEEYEKLSSESLKIIDLLKYYSDKFIPYPFYKEQYSQAQFGFGGGMEHQTISFLGNMNYSLMAHELAHQWFGDYITCASWKEIWLNEGFAEYLEGMTNELKGNLNWLQWLNEQISIVTSVSGGSVYVDDTTDITRIFDSRLSYVKGSMILHMLRFQLGDSIFFTAVRNYLNDKNIAYGFASTSDLKKHFETTADTNLTEFFNDWYYGQGYPIYSILWYQNNEGLNIEISQNTSDLSVDFFEMIIPLKIKGVEKDTMIKIQHIKPVQYFKVPVNFQVENIVFDPQKNIVAKINSVTRKYFEEKYISLYPNPSTDIIYIYKNEGVIINSILIYNIKGQIIYSQSEYYKKYIDIKDFEKGLYIVKINTNQGIFIDKIMKY